MFPLTLTDVPAVVGLTCNPISARNAKLYRLLLSAPAMSNETLYSGSVRTISVVIDCSYVPGAIDALAPLVISIVLLTPTLSNSICTIFDSLKPFSLTLPRLTDPSSFSLQIL